VCSNLEAEKPIVFEGEALREAKNVGFYLWKSGEKSEYAVTTTPDAQGRFQLTV